MSLQKQLLTPFSVLVTYCSNLRSPLSLPLSLSPYFFLSHSLLSPSFSLLASQNLNTPSFFYGRGLSVLVMPSLLS